MRTIGNLFEHEVEDYCTPVLESNFWSNNYIDYEIRNDRIKTLSVENYLNKTRKYLKDVINNLKESATWTNQLTIAINFIFSKDNNEQRVMHSKRDNKEIMINNKAVIEKLFQSLVSGY